MTIEQIKAALKDVNAQLKAARAEALRLAQDQNADAAALTAAQANVQQLQARRDTLKDALDAETEQQSANLQAIRENNDAVKSAASKFRSAGDFFTCVARASGPDHSMDPRLADYLNVRSAASGQNLTTDTEGGYLVPPDYADELLNVAESESVLFNDVSRIPVSGNRLIENILDQETRKDSAPASGQTPAVKGRNGGLIAYWKGEAADIDPTKMIFKQRQTDLHKLTGLCYATDEMLEDLPAMSAYISQGFAQEFAFQRDNAILNGSGSGQPLGILAAGNTALVTIAKESGQAAGTLMVNNILKMWNAMPAKNRANAKWIINQDLEIVLYSLLLNTGSVASEGLTVNTGMPLFVPAGGLASAPNGLLLGRPILPVEQAPALGAAGDISFVDLSQYRWIDKSGVNAQTSIHVRFIQDETAFRFTYRAGGRPIWPNAIEAYKGTTSRSPYVALGARA